MTWYIPLEDVTYLLGVGFVVGFFIGMGLVFYWLGIISFVDRKSFKRFYLELNDKDRGDLKKSLDVIETELENVSRRTNTRFFRRLFNRFIRFKTFLVEKFINY